MFLAVSSSSSSIFSLSLNAHLAQAVAATIPARQSCMEWANQVGLSPPRAAPLPLVVVPTTLGGGLAAGSPRVALHLPEEAVLTAPRWRPGLGADPAALVHLDPGLFGHREGEDDADALGLLTAATLDLLLARALAQQRARRRQAGDDGDDGDDDDDDDDAYGVDYSGGGGDISGSAWDARVAQVLAVLEGVFRAERARGARPPPPPGSPRAVRLLELDPAARAALLASALEVGVLGGVAAWGDAAPIASLARGLHAAHFPGASHARVAQALLPPCLAALVPPETSEGAGAGGGLFGPGLVEAISASRATVDGRPTDAPEWEREVRRWVAADLPDLRAGGGEGSRDLTVGVEGLPISASSPGAMIASLEASALVARPVMELPGGLADLLPIERENKTGVNARLRDLLTSVGDPYAEDDED